MRFKNLGRSSDTISAIGQGTGLSGYSSNPVSYDKLDNLIRVGMELGMSFIDTAPVYGNGLSELAVGRAIAGQRDKFVIATKVSPENNTSDGVVASAEASLRQLGTDFIDLYQVHWPNPTIPISETMTGMAKLVEAGKIGHVGVSNFSLSELKKAEAALSPHALSAMQFEYNLFDRIIEDDLLPYCQAANISVIAYSPLHRGLVANGANQLAVIERIAAVHRKTPAQIALRWLIEKDQVVVIPNTSRLERVKQNAEAADFDLNESEVDEIDRACAHEQRLVPTESILVDVDPERSSYGTLEEALENNLNFSPSPEEIADQIQAGDFLKPVRLGRTKIGDVEFTVLDGRLRYWAWIIAHGSDVPIPALIQEDS